MRLFLSIILLWVGVAGSSQAGTLDLQSILRKKVTINFDGVTLENVIQSAADVTGLDIIPLKSISDNRSQKDKIYLNVKDMPVEQLIDWLAGVLGARYRIYPDGRVYLSENYEWVEINKFGMLFIDLEKMISGSQELEQFDSSISEITKIITIFDDNYYLRIEEQADMIKLVAHIPRELKAIFIKLIDQFNQTGTSINNYKTPDNVGQSELVSKLASVKKINYPYSPLNVIIKKLEIDYGVNIACASYVYSDNDLPPEVSLKLGKVTLKEAIECVIEKTSLEGAELSLPNGIWLTKYKSNWQEAVSRRFLWSDTIVIRSYNIQNLNMVIPGDILVKQIMNNVAVRAWFDPLASILFHKKSGNLIVLAGIKTQNRVLAALKQLSSRIEKRGL